MVTFIATITLLIHAPAAPRAEVPLLAIVSVTPDSNQTCKVRLKNVHERNAIAWAVSSPGGQNHGTDVLLVPELVMAPGATADLSVSCPEGPTTPLVVGLVQYDDGSVAGDGRQFESTQAGRRRWASGLREFVRVLWATPPPDLKMDGVEAARRVIATSAGPHITGIVSNALGRALRALPGGTGDYNAVRAALMRGLEENILTLDRFTQPQ